MVQSRQMQPLRVGDRVEAVGYPFALGVQQCLKGGLYRLAASTNPPATALDTSPDPAPLRLAEQVRDLNARKLRDIPPSRSAACHVASPGNLFHIRAGRQRRHPGRQPEMG